MASNVFETSGPDSCKIKQNNLLKCRLKHVIDGGPQAITEQIARLDHELTIGKATVMTISLLIVTGLAFTAAHDPWWLLLTGLGVVMLIQYLFGLPCAFGWAYRQLGLRTRSEVEEERLALKALRGDFQNLPTADMVEDRDALARLEGEGGPPVDNDPGPDAEQAVDAVLEATRR